MENPFLENIQNPVEYRVTWSGSKGLWVVYDTESKEKYEMAEISFIPLEVLNTVKGWDGKTETGIYSNEIKNTKTQEFNVRSGNGTICQGLWNDIKFEVKAKGGKWANVAYALLVGKKENKLATITFVGSSVGVWIDAKGRKGAHMYKCGKNAEVFKTPKGDEYYKPTIEMQPITADQKQEAIEAYQPLAEFFASRKERQAQEEAQPAQAPQPAQPTAATAPPMDLGAPAVSDNDTDDLPF